LVVVVAAGGKDDNLKMDRRTVADGRAGICQPPRIPSAKRNMSIPLTDPFLEATSHTVSEKI